MKTVTFAREPLTDALWAEAMPLLAAHWGGDRALPGHSARARRRDVSRDRGERRRPVLHGARRPSSSSATRSSSCARTPHYKSSVQAVQDVLYLDPSSPRRHGLQVHSLVRRAARRRRRAGVYHHVKAKHDFGKLLERQGYELVDYIFAKRLD
jgi:hypothetical protein